MAGPGALLLLGGLLGGSPNPGGPGGSETPPVLEEEVSIIQRSDPHPPHCFTRTLHELSCFWDSPGEPDPRRFILQYRLEHDPWQQCPLGATALSPGPGGSRSRFWCSLPAAATVTFVPLELRVLPGTAPGTPGTTERHPKITGTTEGHERPPKITGTPEGHPKITEGHPETTGTSEGPPETPEGHPEINGTTGTTGTTPKITGTPEGHPKITERPLETPETTGTTEGAPETPEGPEGPPEISEGSPEISETPEGPKRPPETSETPEGPPKTSETPDGPLKTSEGPETPKGPPKTPETPPGTPLFQRTIFIDQLVLPGPPQNVSVSGGDFWVLPGPPQNVSVSGGRFLGAAGAPPERAVSGGLDIRVLPGPPQNVSVTGEGSRGSLCVRWAPPPGPYLHSSLVFELALSPPGGPPKTVGVPAGRREQGVGGLRASTPYSVRARARPDGLSYGGFWSPWSPPATGTTAPELDAVTLGLSCLLVLLLLGLGALGLLGHRRTLRAKLWPPVPGPEREFEGLFSNYGGNFQLWLCQGPGSPCAPPSGPSPPPELESAVEEVGVAPPGGVAPEAPPPPPPEPPETPPPGPAPSSGPSPSPSFEYTLFDPGSALLCPSHRQPGHAPYANLAPPTDKGAEPKWAGHAPHYVICS